MKAKNAAMVAGGILFLAGCASSHQTAVRDHPVERRTGMPALDDVRPIPVVTQHDPAGLSTTDRVVNTQEPKLRTANTAAGAPAQSQADTVSLQDTELAGRVKEAILKINNTDINRDPAITSRETNGEIKARQNLEVSARNGVVILSGTVLSEEERSAIEQAAAQVSGVKSVNNYLAIAASAEK